MNNPPLDELVKHVDSRYGLVMIASKRARQIVENDPESIRSGAVKPVSQAFKEISQDKIHWHVED